MVQLVYSSKLEASQLLELDKREETERERKDTVYLEVIEFFTPLSIL